MTSQSVLFDKLQWCDPIDGSVLEPIVTARTPGGVPLCGALRRQGTVYAYPIVDSIARLTPELASRYREWLKPLGLLPPPMRRDTGASFQPEATVDSFGFQWAWNSAMRSERDLRWRVADRFKVDPSAFGGKIVLDAGCGAGDQSRWLLDKAAQVVSIDLSAAIDVTASKLRLRSGWVGVQGDITALPFEDSQFQVVYCEGVIQHTRDSALTVRELCRVLKADGIIMATHYGTSARRLGRANLAWRHLVRHYVSRWDRYKLLCFTGILSALAYVPLIGPLLRLTTVPYSALMPDFKTTWTNTFDGYGNHAYQRFIEPKRFRGYFDQVGNMEQVYQADTIVVARKGGLAAPV